MSAQKSANTVQLTAASGEISPFANAAEYYGTSHASRKPLRRRAYSVNDQHCGITTQYLPSKRRLSQDAIGLGPRVYLLDVADTRRRLLAAEDTDGNVQITVEDHGPKTINLGTATSNGYRHFEIRGTYALGNLLQELTLAQGHNRNTIILDEARVNENPVNRLSRLIAEQFWPNLTRRIDGSNIFQVARDPKDWTAEPTARIYVPRGAPEMFDYYSRIAEEHAAEGQHLDVRWLAADPGRDEYVRDLNEAPGLLAIEMERLPNTKDGRPDFRGLPFVVPGGRFNELYGWDSYMESLGLMINGRTDLCESMVRHFLFCIKHYGKILNANRTYYLCRSQPPFLTDMALRVHDRIRHRPDSHEFLRESMLAAIKDYYTTWVSHPRLDKESGLSRYVPGGIGVPPETEATHFIHILKPYAEKHNMSFAEFVKAYNYGHVFEPELDEYFLHDRSVRESGHDTSYRLEKVSAHLATVDLNSLLYKIETDIARTIRTLFDDRLEVSPEWRVPGMPAVESSSAWDRRAVKRRAAVNQLMWNEEHGMFFDYNTKTRQQTGYESATTFWALWSGLASPEQANAMTKKALPRFEMLGGLVSGTEESRGPVGLSRPNRQWDYPFGWAPQQILAWHGLLRYGYEEIAQRLAYRWVHMVTRSFVDFNGVVVEKYDVTKASGAHKVTAEYGNQGADFQGVATEGFGWVNASYVLGLQIVTAHMRRALGAVTSWEDFAKMTSPDATRKVAPILDKTHQHRETHGDTVETVRHHVAIAPLPQTAVHAERDETASRSAEAGRSRDASHVNGTVDDHHDGQSTSDNVSHVAESKVTTSEAKVHPTAPSTTVGGPQNEDRTIYVPRTVKAA